MCLVFKKDEPVTYWYLLLSGEVELYAAVGTQAEDPTNFPSTSSSAIPGDFSPEKERTIRILEGGVIFGELNPDGAHSCSARVRRFSEFVRIPQRHFIVLYNVGFGYN